MKDYPRKVKNVYTVEIIIEIKRLTMTCQTPVNACHCKPLLVIYSANTNKTDATLFRCR